MCFLLFVAGKKVEKSVLSLVDVISNWLSNGSSSVFEGKVAKGCRGLGC